MNTLYVMCGIAGSGKTTASKILAKTYNAKVHSYDEFPNARGNPDKDGKIKRQYWESIINDLKQGLNVICDDANILLEDRMYIFNILAEFKIDCKKVLFIIDTPIEECIKRNAQRQGVERIPEYQIPLMAKIKEEPMYSEGWDEIKCIQTKRN